jgi:hypothetical protein
VAAHDATSSALPRGYTTADLARRFRVSEDRIRTWIKSGELRALNTSARLCGRPRFIVTPEALAEFERRRGVSPPKPRRRRRQKRTEFIDFFPGD